MNEQDIKERDESRKMQEEIHAGIFGSEKFKYPGLIKDMSVVKKKLDRDHTLLWPNRVLFLFGKTYWKQTILIIFFLIAASFFGISNVDAIKLFIEGIL